MEGGGGGWKGGDEGWRVCVGGMEGGEWKGWGRVEGCGVEGGQCILGGGSRDGRLVGGGYGGRVERWKVEGGWMMGGESNGPGQVKHPEKQIFHTTSARDCRGRPPHI